MAMELTLSNDEKQKLKSLYNSIFLGPTTILAVACVLVKITGSFPVKLIPRNKAEIILMQSRETNYAGGGEINRMYHNITVLTSQVKIRNDTSLNGCRAVMGTTSTGGIFPNVEIK